MREIIRLPSATTIVIAALEAELPALGFVVPVAGTVPNPRPTSFVRVLRTGGVRSNLVVDAAQVTVEAWAPTEVQSHDLCSACRAVVNAMWGSVVDGATVYRIDEFSGPAHLPDPISEQPRHTFTSQVLIRGAAA